MQTTEITKTRSKMFDLENSFNEISEDHKRSKIIKQESLVRASLREQKSTRTFKFAQGVFMKTLESLRIYCNKDFFLSQMTWLLFTSPKINMGCTSPKINLGCTSPKINSGCTSPKKWFIFVVWLGRFAPFAK